MKEIVLFSSQNGLVTNKGLLSALKSVNSDECDILFVHSGMNFGMPSRDISRKDLLAEISEVLFSLNVDCFVFPTFTFSFCNNKDFDVQNSPTPMGSLNEFVRKQASGVRTKDPLLSMYIVGKTFGLDKFEGPYSIGPGSGYDKLHNSGKTVRFLFLGCDMKECFTFTHYAEAMIGVPYRYNKTFSGLVIDDGISHQEDVILYTGYANFHSNPIPVVYNAMNENNLLQLAQIGNGSLCSFYETDGWNILEKLLTESPLCLTDGFFNENQKDTFYDTSTYITSVK